MSLAELTSSALPRANSTTMLRALKQKRLQLHKVVRRRARSYARILTNWQKNQYYLASAARDLRAAASRNEDIVLASAFISLTLVFAYASTATYIFLQSFLTMSYLNDLTGFSVLPLFVMFGGVLATLTAWVVAWVSNIMSIAIMDGSTRRRIKSLRTTFHRGLRLAARTTISWILFLTVLFAPIFAVGLLALLVTHIFTAGGTTPYFEAATLVSAGAILWLLYAFTSFALLPQVALFEPELSLPLALRRSRNLVVRRGRPFILSLALVMVAFLGGSYLLTMQLAKLIGTGADILLYVASLVAVISTNMMLTTLYRKRRLARTN